MCSGPHRQVHKAQRGDDAADEADDERAVRHEHHLGGGAHGHPSGQRGILDVHLGRAGRGVRALLKTSCATGTKRFPPSLRLFLPATGARVLMLPASQSPRQLPPSPGAPPAPRPRLTMSSLPFLCRALDSATVVSTQAAKEQ